MNYTATDRRNVLVMHHDPLLRAGLVGALRQHPAFDVFVDGETAASDMDSPRTARGLVEEPMLVQHAPLLPRTHSNALRPQFA